MELWGGQLRDLFHKTSSPEFILALEAGQMVGNRLSKVELRLFLGFKAKTNHAQTNGEMNAVLKYLLANHVPCGSDFDQKIPIRESFSPGNKRIAVSQARRLQRSRNGVFPNLFAPAV